MISAGKGLDRVHIALDQRGSLPAEFLPPDIYDSWMRCISLGLDTRRPPEIEIVSQATLRQEQQRCSLVRGLALAEMHSLHQQIAGSNFLIAFANPDGLLARFRLRPQFSRCLRRCEHPSRFHVGGGILRHQRAWHRRASEAADCRAWRRAFLLALQSSDLHRLANFRAGRRAGRHAGRFIRLPVAPDPHPGAGGHGGHADRKRPFPREPPRRHADRLP